MNQNILSNLKLEGWFFLHNRRKFWSDLLKSIHILRPGQSEYWEDCTRFYFNDEEFAIYRKKVVP